MRRKVCLSVIVLMALIALLTFSGLFVRNAICKLVAPEVDVIPPEVIVGQQLVVKATISVMTC